MTEDFEDAGQRYAFLLRPVKDLSKNFEINIAKELDDYCQQLRNAAENEEYGVDNQHRFNFAEAAMLIQGSAFVFGRKVDYVHSQALHFFEALKPQKSKKKKKAGDDDDEGFVDDDGAPLDPCDLLDFTNIKCCIPNSLYKDYHKCKFKGKPPKITVMPMSLMPLSDDEKNGVLIYSTGYRQEIVGKMDDFKMNAGFLNNDGVLLLQLAHNKIVNDFASEAFLRLWHPYLFANPEEPKNPLDSQRNDTDSGRGTPTENANIDAGRASSAIELARRATSGTITDLHSARPSTCLLEAPETQSQKMEVDDGGDDGGACCYDDEFDTAASMHIPEPEAVSKRQSRMQKQQPRITPWETTDEDLESDPTENLSVDPFTSVQWKTKPVETIKRFIKGTAIATRLEKVEKATMTFQKQTMQTNDYVREHFYMRKKHKTSKGDDWQADALYRFILAVMKRRAEAKRERKAKARPAIEAVYNEDLDDGGNIDDDGDIDQGNNENIPPKNVAGHGDSETNFLGKEGNVVEAQDVVSAEPLKFGDIEDDDLQNSIDINSLYGGCQPSGETQCHDDGHPHTRKHSLLALLHEHMLKFWSTTEEVTSELVTRVQEWEDTMMPILEEEETRKEFDIHEYGDELLNMFKEVGEVKTIDELMEGRKRYEISRYFLACLMMANTYNVKVEDEVRTDGVGRQLNTMRVTLLKRDRHHEVFDQAGAL